MVARVPDSVLRETVDCPYDFRCLENKQCGDPKECEVDYADGRNMLFLKSTVSFGCPYRMLFAGNAICRCPTHYAIFHMKPEKNL